MPHTLTIVQGPDHHHLLFISDCLTASQPLSAINSSSGGENDRWDSAGANGGGRELMQRTVLHLTHMHYVTLGSAGDIQTFHCE